METAHSFRPQGPEDMGAELLPTRGSGAPQATVFLQPFCTEGDQTGPGLKPVVWPRA